VKYNPDKHHRRSIRLPKYDYSSSGAYFITICTHQRECLFGEIVDGEMQLNPLGQLVHVCWQRLPFHFPNLQLDAFVVMPNHVHGILVLADSRKGEASGRGRVAQYENHCPDASPLQPRGTIPGSVGSIVQNFKSVSAQRINRHCQPNTIKIWQRNYYEHIVRNEESLQYIRQYIQNNPLSWQDDQLHPNVPSKW
jgi:REP element-mobilizing transposase RayT